MPKFDAGPHLKWMVPPGFTRASAAAGRGQSQPAALERAQSRPSEWRRSEERERSSPPPAAGPTDGRKSKHHRAGRPSPPTARAALGIESGRLPFQSRASEVGARLAPANRRTPVARSPVSRPSSSCQPLGHRRPLQRAIQRALASRHSTPCSGQSSKSGRAPPFVGGRRCCIKMLEVARLFEGSGPATARKQQVFRRQAPACKLRHKRCKHEIGGQGLSRGCSTW